MLQFVLHSSSGKCCQYGTSWKTIAMKMEKGQAYVDSKVEQASKPASSSGFYVFSILLERSSSVQFSVGWKIASSQYGFQTRRFMVHTALRMIQLTLIAVWQCQSYAVIILDMRMRLIWCLGNRYGLHWWKQRYVNTWLVQSEAI